MNEPKTLNEAIDRVLTVLHPMNWTDRLYGRAQDVKRQTAGMERPMLVPMIYTGAGEYLDARPNDEASSVVFFRVRDPEKSDFDRAIRSPSHRIRVTREVSIMGWVNLREMKDYNDGSGTLEKIKLELKRELKYVGCVIRIGDWQDGLIDDVFRGYMLEDLGQKFGEFPFLTFRLDIQLMMIEPN